METNTSQRIEKGSWENDKVQDEVIKCTIGTNNHIYDREKGEKNKQKERTNKGMNICINIMMDIHTFFYMTHT